MPVVADSAYQNRKAGGALENAAEEILNGIFCHYEPPTSTKAQKNAAKAVRNNPSKFLYEEQPTKPLLLKKKVITTPSSDRDYESGSDYNYETDTDIGEYEEEAEPTLLEEEENQEQTLLKVQIQQPETPSKRGIKWRDEESKRIEQEREKAKTASSWSQCMTLPCFTDGHEIPGTLEDIQDENIVPQEPTPLGAATPTKSALKRRDDGMKVLYDDQGNPNTTPKSPGSIKNHSFFRNVTNSPRAQFFEPKDYNKPSTPTGTAFKMPRDFTPRPNKSYPAPPSDVGLPSPAAATVQFPGPPTPKAAPMSPMQVSQIPGSPGVSEYQFSRDHIAAPPQRIRQIGPLPGSPGIKDQRGGPNVIRLAKIGRSPVQAAHSPRPIASVAAAAAAAADQQTWRGVDPAMSQTGTYVARSPKSYMAPTVAPQPLQPSVDIETPAQISVVQAVQMLNKAGFNPSRRFNRGFNAKSFKIKAPPKSPSTQQHHGYAAAAAATTKNNDNRDSLIMEGENKPSFVGTRRVAPPTSLVVQSSSNPNTNNNSALLNEIKHSRAAPSPFRPLELNTDLRDELEMARDPTPRQMKIQELEDGLRFSNNNGGPLPPTPRRKKEEQPEYTTRPTPTAQKPPQHFVPGNSGSERTAVVVPPMESKKKESSASQQQPKKKKEEQKKVEKKTTQRRVKTESTTLAPAPSSRPRSQSQSRSTTQNNKKKEKKGFMSGLKKGLGKLKNTVNEIDSQRIPEPTAKKRNNGGSRREVRMA